MTPDINFECMFFNPFTTKECIVDNDHDPDVDFTGSERTCLCKA